MVDASQEAWVVETSKDGERWRFFGKAWARVGEPVLLHAVPVFVRFRRDDDGEWCDPLAGDASIPMTLLRLEDRVREDVWPAREHFGLPVVLPCGEAGRLVSFRRSPEGDRWTYTHEFRGRSEEHTSELQSR